MTKVTRTPIEPERIRAIGGQSFAWISHRFLRDGFFANLTAEERSLYLFLVLASDRCGVSFYGPESIASALEVTLDSHAAIRDSLIDMDLIAFDGKRFQVLDLPAKPVPRFTKALRTAEDREELDPVTIRRTIRESLAR